MGPQATGVPVNPVSHSQRSQRGCHTSVQSTALTDGMRGAAVQTAALKTLAMWWTVDKHRGASPSCSRPHFTDHALPSSLKVSGSELNHTTI